MASKAYVMQADTRQRSESAARVPSFVAAAAINVTRDAAAVVPVVAALLALLAAVLASP